MNLGSSSSESYFVESNRRPGVVKALHVIPSVSDRSGGPAQAIFPMCRALLEQGIDVLLVTTDADLNLNAETPVQTDHKGVPTLFFSAQLGNSFKYSRPLAKWLDDNVAKFDLVHIHAVFNHACVAAARACRKHNVPYIIRPLGTLDPWSMKQKRIKKSLFWLTTGRSMLKNASAIHYTSDAERFRTEGSLKLSRGNVVPLGADFSRDDDFPDDKKFITEFPQLRNHPFVLVMSRLDPKKGIPTLIRSFLTLKTKNKFLNWRLVIAGDGETEYVAHLKETVRKLNGTESVQFTGWLSGEMKTSILRNAGLLALTSYQENFGICVMEAMACGVPVLISSHVDLSREVSNANAGWIVDVDDQSVTRSLEEALANDEERASRGKAGMQLAMGYTWERIGSELSQMYSAIATSLIT